MVRALRRRLPLLLGVVLLAALILPASALGLNWSRSPVSPLVPGGVHSVAKFEHLLLHSTKVRSAVKGVIKADGLPSWVFSAAVAQAKAGHVHSAFLHPGTHIGAMAFGPVVTKIVTHTVWTGEWNLPYYYVRASHSVVQGGFTVVTSYRVALAKTCGNPFVFGRTVTRTPLTYDLYIEKRSVSTTGTLLGGWEVTGTVGAAPIDVTTNASGATLVGSFAVGTAYNLTEVLKPSWVIVSPTGGNWTGVMPAGDLTLIFVNREEAID
jgi:hypothetical protein